MDIGWLAILGSKFLSINNLRKKITITPNIRGSVGINIPIPPNSSSSRLNEKGVEKTINQISLSIATKAINNRAKVNGSKENQYISKAIKALFAIINRKLKIRTIFDFR